ncbi:MAG: putative transcriptional regulator [Ignavibacteria bacterium]|nr:putative transcriptional regulator [Ignavibacteria bacterium]
MFKLSKKVEYGILSLQYMANQNGNIITAKEISEHLNISFEFLSKTLQSLIKQGLIESIQGVHGGYKLAKPADKITFSDVIRALENRSSIVECLTEDIENCGRISCCTIKTPMTQIQDKINNIFDITTIAEIAIY